MAIIYGSAESEKEILNAISKLKYLNLMVDVVSSKIVVISKLKNLLMLR